MKLHEAIAHAGGAVIQGSDRLWIVRPRGDGYLFIQDPTPAERAAQTEPRPILCRDFDHLQFITHAGFSNAWRPYDPEQSG